MAFLQGITWLLVFQLIGEVGVRWLSLPVPGPVVGMILLFAVLLLLRSAPGSLDGAAHGLLGHLSLLFVPAGVGIMVHADRLWSEWLPIVAVLLVTTVVTMLATAWIMMLATRLLTPEERQDG